MAISVVTMMGGQICGLASSTASLAGSDYACSRDEYAGVGWVTLGLLALALFAVHHARRERRRQDRYLL